MKVKDVIRKLEACNPDAEVYLSIIADPDTFRVGDILTAYEKDKEGEFVFVDDRAFTSMSDELAVLLESDENG
jgi:hypothetical protein